MKKKEAKKPRTKLKSISIEDRETIIEYLKTYGATKSNTPELKELINKKSYRALEDRFIYLEEVEGILIKGKDGRANTWRLNDKDSIREILSQKDYETLNYVIETEKENFDESTIKDIEKIFKTNQNYMKGHLNFYEEFKDSETIRLYDQFIYAIKNHKYLKLEFSYDKIEVYNNVKPIKIIFIDNNWYIAFEYTNKNRDDFILRRLTFIKKLIFLKNYIYSDKNGFQKKDLNKYADFIDNIQNAMTLFNVGRKIATIKATPFIAKYFQKNMKKFLSSQKFKEELEDGSIIFTIEYTQDLEILPFIQKWLPDLIILEPKELRDAYISKLKGAIDNNSL